MATKFHRGGAPETEMSVTIDSSGTDGDAVSHRFRQLAEDAYELAIVECGEPFIVFTISRLHRERADLHGEVSVECNIAGAMTFNGVLSAGKLNLASQRARTELAGYLTQRARTKDVDWRGLLDEVALRVVAAEKIGRPAVDLRTVPRPGPEAMLDLEGLILPRRHPSILFGDGGGLKSYLMLYSLGRLRQQGIRVGLFDWELDEREHRERLECLFGADMPELLYVRCDQPLVYETERLRRYVREHKLEYAGFDSIGFAVDGPPESAEIAGKYFRAVRQIGIGSLHNAHVNKSDSSDQKPFGSTYWHNGARATWFCKLSEEVGSSVQIGLYHRKANLGPLLPAIGFDVTFSKNETRFNRIDLARVPDLATKLPIADRMLRLLQGGAMTVKRIADELDVTEDAIRKVEKRKSRWFTRVPDASGVYRIGLVQRQ
jgi:hypothetical protein